MSLFDNIMTEADNAINTTKSDDGAGAIQPENPATDGPTWWWDKNTPGSGERPEWLPSKYKSAEDAARAFKELEKRLGSAPDEYDWSKGQNWIESDYEPFHDMAAYLKSKHVPQDVMDKMLETVGSYLDEFKVDYAEEKKLLGEGAEERLRVLNNWAKSNFSEETRKALTDSMRTADSVKAIEEIRNKMLSNNTNIPTGNETAIDVPKVEDIQLELQQNMSKYTSDPKYRAEIKAKMERALSQQQR